MKGIRKEEIPTSGDIQKWGFIIQRIGNIQSKSEESSGKKRKFRRM
jgi:hypothetical protein